MPLDPQGRDDLARDRDVDPCVEVGRRGLALAVPDGTSVPDALGPHGGDGEERGAGPHRHPSLGRPPSARGAAPEASGVPVVRVSTRRSGATVAARRRSPRPRCGGRRRSRRRRRRGGWCRLRSRGDAATRAHADDPWVATAPPRCCRWTSRAGRAGRPGQQRRPAPPAVVRLAMTAPPRSTVPPTTLTVVPPRPRADRRAAAPRRLGAMACPPFARGPRRGRDPPPRSTTTSTVALPFVTTTAPRCRRAVTVVPAAPSWPSEDVRGGGARRVREVARARGAPAVTCSGAALRPAPVAAHTAADHHPGRWVPRAGVHGPAAPRALPADSGRRRRAARCRMPSSTPAGRRGVRDPGARPPPRGRRTTAAAPPARNRVVTPPLPRPLALALPLPLRTIGGRGRSRFLVRAGTSSSGR